MSDNSWRLRKARRPGDWRNPQKLAMLVPGYLDHIPDDLFSDKPLIYRPSEKGYLLYSVGINGRGEGGRSYEDEPPGDDLRVRMPLPPRTLIALGNAVGVAAVSLLPLAAA